mgnify:CR=1 FL=1
MYSPGSPLKQHQLHPEKRGQREQNLREREMDEDVEKENLNLFIQAHIQREEEVYHLPKKTRLR